VLSGLLRGQIGPGILSKDYEIKSVYEENDFMISHLHTLLKRY
jgi:hypothetical protein